MGVSRSRDDYRLGEARNTRYVPPSARQLLFFFSPFLLDIDRDGGTVRRRGPRDVRRLPEKRRIRAPTEERSRWVPAPMRRLRQDVSNFAPTIYIAFFSSNIWRFFLRENILAKVIIYSNSICKVSLYLNLIE